MQTPLISILVPFKNTESYIVECLDSIVQQTYSHWELIIIDDGSTDASYQLVQNYANSDARIHLLSNTGNGIIEALRTGYKLAKGTFVTRMDSDDVMALNFIERAKNGESNILWPGKVKFFAQSSGTTNNVIKNIPVTLDSLKDCHYKGGKDLLKLNCQTANQSFHQ